MIADDLGIGCPHLLKIADRDLIKDSRGLNNLLIIDEQ